MSDKDKHDDKQIKNNTLDETINKCKADNKRIDKVWEGDIIEDASNNNDKSNEDCNILVLQKIKNECMILLVKIIQIK